MWLVVLSSFLAHAGLILGLALLLRPEAKERKFVTFSISTQSRSEKAASNGMQRAQRPRAAAVVPYGNHQSSPQSSDEPALAVGDSVGTPRGRTDLSRAPRPSHIIKPALPERAILHEVEGEVALQLVIGSDGRVKDAQLIQKIGYGIDELALVAIKQSTFDPAEDSDGNAIEGRVIHRYSFRFSDE